MQAEKWMLVWNQSSFQSTGHASHGVHTADIERDGVAFQVETHLHVICRVHVVDGEKTMFQRRARKGSAVGGGCDCEAVQR